MGADNDLAACQDELQATVADRKACDTVASTCHELEADLRQQLGSTQAALSNATSELDVYGWAGGAAGGLALRRAAQAGGRGRPAPAAASENAYLRQSMSPGWPLRPRQHSCSPRGAPLFASSPRS